MSLKVDRETLHELGLNMPRLTPKYWVPSKHCPTWITPQNTFTICSLHEKDNRFFITNLSNWVMYGSMESGIA